MTEGFQRWEIGDLRVTSVVEDQTDHIPPELFFPAASVEQVLRHEWLQPHFADPEGRLSLRVQALVVEAAGRTIVVDPCVGNGKPRSLFYWNEQHWPFMERFTAAGFDPAQVDLVVHTHLHTDHVGWGTYLDGGQWVPTFTNARYLYVEPELAWARSSTDDDAPQIYADSIAPIEAAGLADVVPVDADLGTGLHLEPTTGHTPGHVALWLDSAGETALLSGDVVHHPLQLAEPSLAFAGDERPEAAAATRRQLMRRVADADVLTFGAHFPTLPAGRVVSAGEVWRFEPTLPVPSSSRP
jgi:glyoxylase-like metal-dependent hydrolase (beta-lactamase superfamily II)